MFSDVIKIQQINDDDLPVVEVENEELRISIIPDMGGKVIELTRKQTGTQFLQEPPINYSLINKPKYGEEFQPPHAAGFDECFPNVSPSKYIFNGEEIILPDHGELWTKPWEYEINPKGISLWTHGKQIKYRFTKHIELSGSTVTISYKLENLEEYSFDYIWSAHPLLKIKEGDELLLPSEVDEVILNWASNTNVGHFGDKLEWPKILGNHSNIDFNYVQNKSMSLAAKLFTNRLEEGKAGIYKEETNESLVFSFQTNQIPFLGIWLCYGGWPIGSNKKDYTLALEPCNARPDSLEEACKWKDQQKISPHSIECWEVDITIVEGKKNL